MNYIKLIVAYDGTNYNGFQRQKNGVGVQQILEAALTELFGEKILLKAAGRTDAGVHALGQVVSFATNATVPASHIPRAIKHLLPSDIVVCRGEVVDKDFNARYSAIEKTYQYKIFITDIINPCLRNYTWQLKDELDIKAMETASKFLLGTHDFTAFQNSGSQSTSPLRTIMEAKWHVQKAGELIFTIRGDGFLYRMVRNIVGLLVKIGKKQLKPADFKRIMQSKDRKQVGMSAPAQGLYLVQVKYQLGNLVKKYHYFLDIFRNNVYNIWVSL